MTMRNHLSIIKTNEIFKQLREEIENGYFENLIKEYLIDNNHKTIVVMKPKKGLQKIKDQEEADKIKGLQRFFIRRRSKEISRRDETVKSITGRSIYKRRIREDSSDRH